MEAVENSLLNAGNQSLDDKETQWVADQFVDPHAKAMGNFVASPLAFYGSMALVLGWMYRIPSNIKSPDKRRPKNC